MPYDIIIKNQYATVRYETDHKYMYHTFHKPISGQVFRQTMNTALDVLIEKQAIKWLSDDRNNGEFTAADIDFSINEWGPRAAKNGWRYWALVVPESIVGQIGMLDITNTFNNFGVNLTIFSDLEKARQWLIAQ